MTEEWRDIPGFQGYKASDMGRIASCKKRVGAPGGWVIEDEIQRVLSPAIDAGYKFVNLSRGKSTSVIRVHQLVMLAFVGACPDGLEVCHNNGEKADCRPSNLRYDTHLSNLLDAVRHEVWRTEADVVDIRERYAGGESIPGIAADIGCSPSSIRHIAEGTSYAVFGGPVGLRPASSLTIDDLAYMIQLRESGLGYRLIGERFGISESYVCYIFQGKRLPDKFEQARARRPAAHANKPRRQPMAEDKMQTNMELALDERMSLKTASGDPYSHGAIVGGVRALIAYWNAQGRPALPEPSATEEER